MRLIVNRAVNMCKMYLDNVLFGQNNFRNLQLLGPQFAEPARSSGSEDASIFERAFWFAAPKSKVSPSRKKQKHGRFIPDPVDWIKCNRCGESKLPHRICTKNKDICAMRPEDFEVWKKSNPLPTAAKVDSKA